MPGNRCPDCNKWVSLETDEPQVENVQLSSNESVVEVDVNIDRNCAECGGQMKTMAFNTEAEIDETWLAEHGPQEDGSYKEGHGELDVEESNTELTESGGGRYAKNMIGFTTYVQVTCICGSTTSVEISDNAAASEFDEVN